MACEKMKISVKGGAILKEKIITNTIEINGRNYSSLWFIEPTNQNRCFGVGFDLEDGHAVRIQNDYGEYSVQEYIHGND